MDINLIKKILLLVVSIVLAGNYACADQILMRNGDRIEGKVVEENRFELKVYAGADKPIIVNKEFIRRRVREEDPPKENIEKAYVPRAREEFNEEKNAYYEPVEEKEGVVEVKAKPKREEIVKNAVSVWERKISLGYSQVGGNVESSDLAFDVFLNQKKALTENSFGLGGSFSSSERRSTSRKFHGLARTANSFGADNKWYRFLKLEGDHDRFSNIDQRFVPSVGLGYWFSDKEEFKAMLEVGAGAEYTNYRDNTKSETQAVLVPRGYIEKTFNKMKLSQEVIAYPSFKDEMEYRLHSETAVTNPISDNVFLKVSLIDDFNSKPKGDIEKNDYRMTSGLDVKF